MKKKPKAASSRWMMWLRYAFTLSMRSPSSSFIVHFCPLETIAFAMKKAPSRIKHQARTSRVRYCMGTAPPCRAAP
jgi:hypothetical protein